MTERNPAITVIAVFDALDGIDRRYAPYYVTALAPQGANAEAAAAVEAVDTTLLVLYPLQKPILHNEVLTTLHNIGLFDHP